MADDFARLVSRVNPATREYQVANAGYPPLQDGPQPAIDPFFDDEDDMPDSAFGRPQPMQSVDSDLPLSRNAAAPAGHSKITLAESEQPQAWSFDDNIPVQQPNQSRFSSAPPSKPKPSKPWYRRRIGKVKWPWAKEEVLAGERIIALNDFGGEGNAAFESNYVSTTKYNAVTFVPKFLFGMSSFVVISSAIDTRIQNNSASMRTCSSYSHPSFNKYLAYHPLTAGRLSFHLALF